MTGPSTSKAKSNLHNASQKDLSVAYQAANQKRSGLIQSHHSGPTVNPGGHHTNSASSLDKSKYQIDSGVGIISGGQNSLNPRKDVYQRGIQVEMKTAMHSRRKHGSIDTYKQNSTNNHSGSNGTLNH